MAHKKIETIINDKISPYSLNERGKAELAQTIRKYPYELLIECIDIGKENPLRTRSQHHYQRQRRGLHCNLLGLRPDLRLCADQRRLPYLTPNFNGERVTQIV